MNRYITRHPSFTHGLEFGEGGSASHAQLGRHGQKTPATATSDTTVNRGLAVLRRFVKQNRWRLHDLFSRCGYTDTYTMTMEEVATLLERVGGIVPISFALRNSVAFSKAIESEGSLAPLTSESLREVLSTSFKSDR